MFNDNARYISDVLRVAAWYEGSSDDPYSHDLGLVYQKLADECCNLLSRCNFQDPNLTPHRLRLMLVDAINSKIAGITPLFKEAEIVKHVETTLEKYVDCDEVWGEPTIVPN